jgi:hypothetical protein
MGTAIAALIALVVVVFVLWLIAIGLRDFYHTFVK